eukprot:368197_1
MGIEPILLGVCLLIQLLSSAPPSIIIFLADDLGYNDLGSFGSVTINTPHLDRLAAEGMKLTQFYSTAPLCSGSRSALLTGRIPPRNGVYTNYTYPKDLRYRVFTPSCSGALPDTELTLAHFLSQQGYYTKLVGKWHLGHHHALPTQRGFDSFYGLPYSHEEGFPGPDPEQLVYPPVPLYRDLDIIYQPFNESTLQPLYNTEAVAFLHNMSITKQPFLLYMAYEQPHVPLFTEAGWPGISRRGLYGDVVMEMDASIGLIMNKLRSLHIDDNTFVLFASDNGAWIHPSSGTSIHQSVTYPFDGGSNGPFRGGKGSTWEGGSHVPAIIWMPGVVPSYSSCMSPMSNMDLLPTLAELIGFKLPNDRTYDGVSVLSYLNHTNRCNDRDKDPHEFMYYWRAGALYAIRYKQYKAHWITRNGFGRDPPIVHDPPILYNIEWDVAESMELNTTDSASEYGKILAKLENEYVRITTEVEKDLGIPQFNAQDFFMAPCCNKKFNYSEAWQFLKEGDDGLAIWDECVCNYKPTVSY